MRPGACVEDSPVQVVFLLAPVGDGSVIQVEEFRQPVEQFVRHERVAVPLVSQSGDGVDLRGLIEAPVHPIPRVLLLGLVDALPDPQEQVIVLKRLICEGHLFAFRVHPNLQETVGHAKKRPDTRVAGRFLLRLPKGSLGLDSLQHKGAPWLG